MSLKLEECVEYPYYTIRQFVRDMENVSAALDAHTAEGRNWLRIEGTEGTEKVRQSASDYVTKWLEIVATGLSCIMLAVRHEITGAMGCSNQEELMRFTGLLQEKPREIEDTLTYLTSKGGLKGVPLMMYDEQIPIRFNSTFN